MNKEERLMMSKEEARNRAKELLDENQVDLITKYMFLEQQCKKQKEVINRLKELIIDNIGETTYEYIGSNKIKVLLELRMDNDGVNDLLKILKEVE